MKIKPLLIFLALWLALAGPSAAQTTEGEVDEHAVILEAMKPEKADLNAILERGLLRVAIPYTPIYFSYNGDELIGFAVEMSRELEAYLRQSTGKRVDVILIPLPRNQIIPAVVEGRADLAMANLTITDTRKEIVEFADPIFREISEMVVTVPELTNAKSLDDLVGTGVFLRPSSSYFDHLQRINEAREAAGKARVPIHEVAPHFEDYDLLDMLDNGVISATIVDSHKLELWQKVFENIVVHEDITTNSGGEIAWAIRKDSSELLVVINGFIAQARQGTLLGNILSKRYFGSAGWIDEIRTGDTLRESEEIIENIRKYSAQYRFDWRLIFAQAYQESKLEQTAVSDAGAVGVMQILPSTAGDPNVAIPDIRNLENNIHAGIKYLDFIRDRYFDAPEISAHDRAFLSLAAYNAGPGNISRARRLAERMGLDPNVWFSNVEIATGRTVGGEPVIYVRNIFKNFVSFGLISERKDADIALPISGALEDDAQSASTSGTWLGSTFVALVCISAGIYLWRRLAGE